MTAPRVVIADDHELFRDGLRGLLTGLGATVVADVGDGHAAVEAAALHRPDVVFMDLRMPGLGGIEATARIGERAPQTAVVVLTMSEDTASLQAALQAGARGYLLKESSKADVARALEAVTGGGMVIGTGVADKVRHAVGGLSAGVFPQLSDAEVRVLELVADGLDNRAIAGRLFLAEKTVRNRVSSILAKLDVATRAEAIVRARAAGLGGGTENAR
ncbi:response regulator transcription factor [Frankia sp. CNm7]|uniref:Response regulator transcription factor n=1 Tax=Frankia nepalensis TaxID=1836974 RepID=A0A937UKX3_9ACTN|nr:response regulator transcription factor [Frankia nepalensis]MBL7499203.1 response regulator transcription factor [Frankia nepalensis]MBL7515963.1 response regulator transcription factor [Frankia nepalensis]MBL7521890.1 response regulator transcription factor [Frankia nepalensis]MBL7627254.1 response regulator transcription factor [Frankia nepalensis]